MSRVLLIHWNAGEAEDRASILRQAGHEVDCHAKQGSAALRAVREHPPDAFVIDLSRLPSHGRDVAIWLRQKKPTRKVPIVFTGGDPAKKGLIQKLLPDAVFTEWSRIRSALQQALRTPVENPAVPGIMESYSGTPLPKKLGIKSNSFLTLLGAPADFERTLGRLPEGVSIRKQARGRSDVVLLFVRSGAELERRFQAADRSLEEGGRLWIVWPKKASDIFSDLTQISVRAFGLGVGYVDYKISAIDKTWSGLCFAKRRP